MADAFLDQPRDAGANQAGPARGWGQFLDRPHDVQVGLYGTCSAVICIALAYGGDHVPPDALRFLTDRWNSRNNPNTKGPRDFSLTLRLAYFYLALKMANRDDLLQLLAEVDTALRERVVNDLWLDWWISAGHHSQVGKEYTTAFVILAYALPVAAGKGGSIPDQAIRAARLLQHTLRNAEASDFAATRLILASIVSALPKREVSSATRDSCSHRTQKGRCLPPIFVTIR